MNRRSVRATVALVALAAVLVGLASEAVAFGWRSPARWIPDLVVGWTLIASGTVAWVARPDSRTGPLLAVTGFAWFVPNFAGIGGEPITWVTANGSKLHRGLLVHALMTFPTGRLSSGVERGVVAAGYMASIVPALAGDLVAQAFLGALLIGGSAWRTATVLGPARRARAWAVPAATAVGIVLIATAGRLVVPTRDLMPISLLVYEVGLCGVAMWLAAGLRREPWRQATVTDLVVELGDGQASTVRDALARSLGDPTLEVGYAVDGTGGYVDARGRLLELPAPGRGRVATPIELDGRRVGVLVHDPAVLDDPGLVRSIAEAAGLAASNARLQAQVRAQIADVEASRRRLVRAEDDERRRIQTSLEEGTAARLREVSASLAEVQRLASADAHGTTLGRAAQAARQLDGVVEDLRSLASGLHPATLETRGLHAALLELADRAPLPVEVDASPAADIPLREGATAYYVCSEGIANVVKHARATRAVVRCRIDGPNLLVEVIDDGVGGADPLGSGLRGLTDRVEALGGTLIVESRPGKGTRLAAELRLDGEA